MISVAAAVLLSGCASTDFSRVLHPGSWFGKTPTVQVLPAAPDAAALKVQAAEKKAADAQAQAAADLKAASSANAALLSKLKANVVSADAANAENPAGVPKVKVAGELSVAEGRLDGVPTDPVEAAAASARALLVEQGKTEEARQAYTDAVRDGKAQAADLATLKEQAAEAFKAANAAEASEKATVEAYEAKIADNERANTEHLQRVEDSIKSAQVRNLNIAGGLCVVLLALGVGFGGLAGLRMTYPFGIMAAVLFGLAQVVGSLWFHYCVIGGLAIAVIAAAYYLWQRFEEGKTHAAVVAQNTQLTGVLHSVIPVLDSAYDTATSDVKQVLDDKVFTPLATSMDRSEKAAVQTIRATISAQPAAAAAAATAAAAAPAPKSSS